MNLFILRCVGFQSIWQHLRKHFENNSIKIRRENCRCFISLEISLCVLVSTGIELIFLLVAVVFIESENADNTLILLLSSTYPKPRTFQFLIVPCQGGSGGTRRGHS